ncbi:uncharacterized protein F5147DRAFT_652448 [Suillus discolor]|uniref:Uncharacterized protein n=1 Tax=Suillus discolor TaxID=1912936 RepID=A0A9P7F8J6_9AGAM|nr:uncharacterized protein F5147DRAFT_652448 [Suillus discolor]KAG2109364.1 hypothetical protein F5147DRAFT_652448 [Suillus discolor]
MVKEVESSVRGLGDAVTNLRSNVYSITNIMLSFQWATLFESLLEIYMKTTRVAKNRFKRELTLHACATNVPRADRKQAGIGMTSRGSPRKSVGLPKERGKVQKDYPDPDECEKLPEGSGKVLEELPEITMRFRPGTDMCNGYSGQVLSRNKQRKGCRDKVRSRIGPEDHGKVPEELPETRRSVGSEEQSSGLGNSSLGLRWILTKSED